MTSGEFLVPKRSSLTRLFRTRLPDECSRDCSSKTRLLACTVHASLLGYALQPDLPASHFPRTWGIELNKMCEVPATA